jgi:DNA topoisomerase-3
MHYDFPEKCKNWKGTPFTSLYTAPIEKKVAANSKVVVSNLKEAARGVDAIILWLDCDREGEAIAFDVLDVCKNTSKSLKVYRAHFSTVTVEDIRRAIENLTDPNEKLANAVKIRQEIDLRIGASFTRFQTLLIQEMFPKYGVISSGPCQFPTLGFIVERYQLIKKFVPEKFFYLDCRVERETGNKKVEVKFEWERDRLFDELATCILLESCEEAKYAKVIKVLKKEVSRRKPYPLNTIALQKTASRKLHFSGHKIMEIAERLYNKGLISYPRTETSRYTPTINIKNLISRQTGSNAWGDFATRLIENKDGLFKGPLCGKGDDKAHPPIHPVKLARYVLN